MHGRDDTSMHSQKREAPARPARYRAAPSVASAGGCSALSRAEHVEMEQVVSAGAQRSAGGDECR